MEALPTDFTEFRLRVRKNLAKGPQVDDSCYISPLAHISGQVYLAAKVNIWPMASVRGDIEAIYVGEGSNIQDSAVLHVADQLPCRIGAWTTIGHSAIVHACTVGNECLIGMGAIILDGAVVGDQCVIGANALVTQGMKIPDGSMVLGSPGKGVRMLTNEERKSIRNWADRYVILASETGAHESDRPSKG